LYFFCLYVFLCIIILLGPSHVVQWLSNFGAMCSRAWRAQ